jgi:hypothetical protein
MDIAFGRAASAPTPGGDDAMTDDDFERRRREADFERYCRKTARINRAEQRKRLRQQIATIKAVQKAGLPVKRATVAGVDLEFGQPDPPASALPPHSANPWDSIYETEQKRPS